MAKKMNRTLSDELRDIARGVEAGDCTTTVKELLEMAERLSWRPIAEAPNSGHFLVYLADEMLGTRIHAANWHPNVKTIGSLFHFDAPEATHFMPLPEPPKDS